MTKIMVTGGWGFLGSRVVKNLRDNGYKAVRRMRSRYCDLTDCKQAHSYINRFNPDVIIHAAGKVGGIMANKENPGKFFYQNLQMGMNVLEVARLIGCRKVIMIGTVCSYPSRTPVPFKEEELWNGYPEPTNAPYGIAKRTLIELGKAYKEQYHLNVVNLIPVNLYGPRDNFDLHSSHVIPALIRKVWESPKELSVWGTGEPSREFLYVDDAAEAIRLAMENYDDPAPINVGSGKEIKIRELVDLILEKMKKKLKCCYYKAKPDGQMRRCLDTSKAKEAFGFEAKTDFDEGLEKTINWFKRNVHEIIR